MRHHEPLDITDSDFESSISKEEIAILHSWDWMRPSAQIYYSLSPEDTDYLYDPTSSRTSINNLRLWIPLLFCKERKEPFITSRNIFTRWFGILTDAHDLPGTGRTMTMTSDTTARPTPTMVIPRHVYIRHLTEDDDAASKLVAQLARYLKVDVDDLLSESAKVWGVMDQSKGKESRGVTIGERIDNTGLNRDVTDGTGTGSEMGTNRAKTVDGEGDHEMPETARNLVSVSPISTLP